VTARPEVVALLNDLRPGSPFAPSEPLTHKDGRPFSMVEVDAVLTATAYERVEAAEAHLLSPETDSVCTPGCPWSARVAPATRLGISEVEEVIRRRAAAEHTRVSADDTANT
jgi:hypothetical protein